MSHLRLVSTNPPLPGGPLLREIIEAVAKEFAINTADLLGSSRFVEHVVPRMVAMTIYRRATGASFYRIAQLFSRDPTTAHHALARIAELSERDPRLAARIARLQKRFSDPPAPALAA